ncbi:MAG: hypothetical protein FJ303_01615 [Planctomycetes bacterium]|nr:hypothetical protein [Planctomycetota bacterium]
MLQGLRDVWLPWLLFLGTISVGVVLLALVIAVPFAIEHIPATVPLVPMYADDGAVRRTSIAAGLGLIVTACVFFRPGRRMPTSKKPPPDMAGA